MDGLSVRSWLPIALLGLASGAWAQGEALNCQRALLPGDWHELTCPLGKDTGDRVWLFSVRLSGGHDDSSSSVAVRLGDRALPCDAGSKTGSEGEYGDITLTCRFKLPPVQTASSPQALQVAVKASHVQFEGYDLTVP